MLRVLVASVLFCACAAFHHAPLVPSAALRSGASSHARRSSCLQMVSAVDSITDDKRRLLKIVSTTGMGKEESIAGAQEVDAIINKLETLGKGFDEATVDGEWQLVFSRNSKGSPSLQKVFSFQKGFANFDVREKVFHNIVQLAGNKIKVLADVAYEAEGNRLHSTITMAGIKLGPLFIPLPFKGRKGYLDMLYLDDEFRVTKGNRGGVFLHVRPNSLLSKEA
eukprot:TRINITY_DN1683_c0_g1_i2.p1 TRINITY_DN1683_c0_g1~~TRINITY_DN1683_c0_g1_i2.p1  ORF type:complete len:223 (-),score=53.92 TRINITY_DN1683_c0_g1_i2:244-912(-)